MDLWNSSSGIVHSPALLAGRVSPGVRIVSPGAGTDEEVSSPPGEALARREAAGLEKEERQQSWRGRAGGGGARCTGELAEASYGEARAERREAMALPMPAAGDGRSRRCASERERDGGFDCVFLF